MANNKSITNPMLVGAIELLKAEDTLAHRRMVIEELIHATLLSPVIITPEPIPDESGIPRLTPENDVQVPMITVGDRKLFMAFTDLKEIHKWQQGKKQSVFGFSFSNYLTMMQKAGENCDGLIINPAGNNLILGKDMLLGMVKTI